MVYCRHECRIHDFAMKCIFDQHCNVNNFFLLTRRFRRSIQQETGGKRPTNCGLYNRTRWKPSMEFSVRCPIHVLDKLCTGCHCSGLK
ncbi:hypothetical protein T4E_11741 [Trichinella pseudospiralis]|uniref:Uncharacterized protein n=1 Tax=Trichinella pseudospiralis TaxID=6337 RepID=A0A0V0XNF3_TRIPS|nr:hypothetical protein T4E_11741 [Trichinella pseudospiralis]